MMPDKEMKSFGSESENKKDSSFWDKYYEEKYENYYQEIDEILFEESGSMRQSSVQDPFIAALNKMVSILRSKEEESGDYAFFLEKWSRTELFEYCKAIAEYLHDKKIEDLVIIDRSARPLYVGVMEYWRMKYPTKKMPGIFFMNPKGFKTHENLKPGEEIAIAMDALFKEDTIESPGRVRSEAVVLSELKKTYRTLMEHKDKPVLIFDTCIHTGNSLAPVKKILEKSGFRDVRIGSVNPSDPEAKVKTDFYITHGEPIKGCYPFDRDRMIEKTFDHVYSKRSQDPMARKMAVKLRKEIKKIIQELFEKEQRPQQRHREYASV